MFTREIPIFVLCLLVLCPVSGLAEDTASIEESGYSSNGAVIGFGMGYWALYSSWRTPYRYNYYTQSGFHHLDRVVFNGFLDTSPLFEAPPFIFRVRGEIHFGFIGGTKGEYDLIESDGSYETGIEEDISSGGFTAGFAALGKLSLNHEISSGTILSPFVATGPQITILGSNGKDISETFQDDDYEDGWREYVIFLPVSIGADIHLSNLVLGMDLRFILFGGGWSDWEPSGRDDIENQDLSGTMINAYVGFEL
jgi:hypothetical protein